MTVVERIKILTNLEGNSSRFARKVGLGANYVSNMIRRGGDSLNYNTVLKILSAYPEINPIWFLLGEGEMYSTEEQSTRKLQSKIEHNSIDKSEVIKDDYITAYKDLSDTLKKRVVLC